MDSREHQIDNIVVTPDDLFGPDGETPLPLDQVPLFRGLRGQLDGALARARERRSTERDALRRRLRGDEPPTPPGSTPLADPPAVDPSPSDQRAAEHQPEPESDRSER